MCGQRTKYHACVKLEADCTVFVTSISTSWLFLHIKLVKYKFMVLKMQMYNHEIICVVVAPVVLVVLVALAVLAAMVVLVALVVLIVWLY